MGASGTSCTTVPLALAKDVYVSSRDAITYYARLHYESSGGITFVHSETGVRTLKDEFDKVVWHNQQHLDQIERALLPSNKQRL